LTVRHLEPFHRIVVPPWPTAHAAVVDNTFTEFKSLVVGDATGTQDEPL
jgi:hypothetical protein